MENEELEDCKVTVICANCKKILGFKIFKKNKNSFLNECGNSTHSICEECLQKDYPEFAKDALRDIGK